jgi:hypothetical protein
MLKTDDKGEIAELKARLAAAERAALLLRLPALRLAPSDSEMERLFALASAHGLIPRCSLLEFSRCLTWMVWKCPLPEPNPTVSTSWFVSQCEDWQTANGLSGAGNPAVALFGAAAVCQVPYQLPEPRLGVTGALGLASHGGAGRVGDRGWKATLAGEPLRRPTEAPERSHDQRSKVGWM